jgi:hypothetical protein
MRQTTRITRALKWLTTIAASALSIAANAAIPPSSQETTSRPNTLPIVRRLPPIANPHSTVFSIREIADFDGKPMFDESIDDSLDAVLDLPAAVPGKPRVGGWIEVGYGGGWTIQ